MPGFERARSLAVRVLVCGSRSIKEPRLVAEALNCVWALHGVMMQQHLTVIHGGCPQGPDAHASEWVTNVSRWYPTQVSLEIYAADWDKYKKAAGPIRNSEMISKDIDLVLAFWDRVSRGTANMVELAIQRKVPYLLRTV